MKILILGYYGFDNAGDELILDCTLNEIKKRVQGAEITVLSADPDKTTRCFGVAACSRWNPAAVFSAVKTCDLLLCGGGGLFQDKTSTLSLYYYLAVIMLAKLLCKKIFVFAVGISEMMYFNLPLLRVILKSADFVTVRNKESLECFGKNASKMKNAEVTADVVFNRTLSPRKLKTANPCVAFVLRTPQKYGDELEQFAKLADSVSQRLSASILFIPFHKPSDYPYSLKVMNMMRTSPRIVQWDKPSQLFDIFSEVDMVISQRLHALIIATLSGIPAVGIFDDTKLTRFMNEIGQKNISGLTGDNIYSVLAIISDLWVWKDDFQKNTLAILPMLKARASRNIELLRQVAKG